MSVRAAAQVAMETLEEARKNGSGQDESEALVDSVEILREGLIEDRAREYGPDFYKLAVAIFESQMPTKDLTDKQLRLFSNLKAICWKVRTGEDDPGR